MPNQLPSKDHCTMAGRRLAWEFAGFLTAVKKADQRLTSVDRTMQLAQAWARARNNNNDEDD